MRTTNPLRDILETAMRREEPLLDTEWPAGDVALHLEERKPESVESKFLRPITFRPR